MGLSEQNIAEKFRNHVQQRYSTIYDGAMTFVHLHSKIAEDGSVISPISNTSIGEPASTNSQATKSMPFAIFLFDEFIFQYHQSVRVAISQPH